MYNRELEIREVQEIGESGKGDRRKKYQIPKA